MSYTIEFYEKKNRSKPFQAWLAKQDGIIRSIIIAKLKRIEGGNFSTCKSLRKGISEIILDNGPGYRIYYTMIGKTIVLLLCAGIKKKQDKDIDTAIAYLTDYKARGKTHGKK